MRLSLSEFADKINELMPVIMKGFSRQHVNELFKTRVTLPQFFILVFLYREGESKMSDLAHVMNVTTAAMTGIVDRLVRERCLERVYDPEDRRIIKVRLTDKGSELVKKINQQRRGMIIKIFGRISESDRQDYLRILTQIKDILTTESSAIK